MNAKSREERTVGPYRLVEKVSKAASADLLHQPIRTNRALFSRFSVHIVDCCSNGRS